MATAIGRGAQNANSVYFKPMLRKAYHRKITSPDMVGDSTVKLNGEEAHNKKSFVVVGIPNHLHLHDHDHDLHHQQHDDGNMNVWIPDNRTGVYYPKGQEKVMEDVSARAGKDFGINWFSNP